MPAEDRRDALTGCCTSWIPSLLDSWTPSQDCRATAQRLFWSWPAQLAAPRLRLRRILCAGEWWPADLMLPFCWPCTHCTDVSVRWHSPKPGARDGLHPASHSHSKTGRTRSPWASFDRRARLRCVRKETGVPRGVEAAGTQLLLTAICRDSRNPLPHNQGMM